MVKLWEIREETRQMVGRMKRGEGEEEPAVHGMVAVNYYVWDGEEDPTMILNCIYIMLGVFTTK